MGDRTPGKNASAVPDDDPLIARARRMAQAASAKTPSDASSQGGLAGSIQELNENLSLIRRCIASARIIISGLRVHIAAPVWRFVGPPLAFVGRIYLRIWNGWAYVTHKDSGERTLSRTRSSALVVATILFLSMFTTTYLGSAVRFVTIEPVVDGLLIALSKRTEVFFLTQSDEIDPANNVHSVRGCRKRGECSEMDAVYFRVQPRLSHDLWKLATYGNPVYVPDHIVAPIAPGLNECQVTYYGYRMTSSWIARILRSLQFYPTMLEAKCAYVGGGPPVSLR